MEEMKKSLHISGTLKLGTIPGGTKNLAQSLIPSAFLFLLPLSDNAKKQDQHPDLSGSSAYPTCIKSSLSLLPPEELCPARFSTVHEVEFHQQKNLHVQAEEPAQSQHLWQAHHHLVKLHHYH
jgi:hypothetical protein